MTLSNRTSSYDPAQTDVIIGGQTITGFAEGTGIEIERDEDSFTKVTGSNGEVTRILRNNRGAKVILTLLQGSESNLVLSNFLNIDENTGAGAVPAIVKDNTGGSVQSATTAWVLKPAKVNYGTAHESRVWTIDCAQLVSSISGNTTT
jgi:structural protein KPP10_ORF10